MVNISKENRELKDRVRQLEQKLLSNEAQSRRNNLIFYNIPESDGMETWSQCENKVKDILVDHLEITKEVEIERAHRLGQKNRHGNSKPRPIIIKCLRFKDKQEILQNTKKLEGTNYGVSEDFIESVREKRQKLRPHMLHARQQGKRAFLNYDKLRVENQTYIYDSERDEMVEIVRGAQAHE